MPLIALAAAGVSAAGCDTGVGQGEISATVWAPGCGIEGKEIQINPNFFAADRIENLDLLDDLLEIRVQNTSDFEDQSNGINITVRELTRVKEELLGQPIDLSRPVTERLVDFNFYLNDRCPHNFDSLPVNYVARSGTITFESIFQPKVDKGREIAATFNNVEVVDSSEELRDERHATVSGTFRFVYNRGRPAQRFPTPTP